MKKTVYLVALALLAISCRKNPELFIQDTPNTAAELMAMQTTLMGMPFKDDYKRTLPNYLRVLGMTEYPVDNMKAGLGKVLFYDKNLSKDRAISCASCHKAAKAFSDDVAFSTGVEGSKTSRNSLALANVASFSAHYSIIEGKAPLLFWDERSPDVAAQSRQTFANPLEMGMEMPNVVSRIKELAYYPYLWKKVYGDFEPTEEQVLECLQEFVGAMGSHNTQLDLAMEKVQGDLTQSAQNQTLLLSQAYYGPVDTTIVIDPVLGLSGDRGRVIFVNNCSKCHSPIRPFQEVFAACNGLDMNYQDKGLAAITGRAADEGVFKSPSLRNIALTAPYMHDGRFKTLKEVVDFYSDQVQPHPNLHPLMKHNGDLNLHLSDQQKQDLIAFLHTLTDASIGSDPRFSNPFKQ